ncbi:MAG: hypothetical protein AB1500_07000 [Bacillota bacterium]
MKKVIAIFSVLLLVLGIPATALAATDTTNVTGDIAETISISTPATIALGALTVAANNTSADQTLTVYANNSSKTVSLTVCDNNQVADIGKMASGANILTDPLNVKGGDVAAYTALPEVAASTITLENAGAVNGATGQYQVTDFSVRQYVYWSDEQAAGYAITLLFTTGYTT